MRLLTPAALAAAALTVGTLAGPAHADHSPAAPGRDLRSYTVRPGDTATGLAVRFHAWTAELIAHNHLGSSALLQAGTRIEIPVVRSAVRDAEPARSDGGDRGDRSHAAPERTGSRPPRDRVRDTIARLARRTGVDAQLALAVSWQESGWRMGPVSEAGAIGAMQVLPATADWMEWYVGRPLHPRRLHDNVITGVTLLDVLEDHTRTRRRQLGAYYQGLGAVHEHGLYGETHDYVDDVLAIERRLEQGRPPA